MIGLSFCPRGFLASFTGLSEAEVAAAEAALSPALLERDPETDELLVVGAVVDEVGASLKGGDNRCRGILGLLSGIHSTQLVARWWELHGAVLPAEDRSFEAPSKPLRSPFEARAVAGTDTEAVAVQGLRSIRAPSARPEGAALGSRATPISQALKGVLGRLEAST
jgi:hypothetical protein